MSGHLMVSLFLLLLVVHLYVNIRLSSDIVGWVLEPRKRKVFLGLVWLLPVLGALYVYRRVAPEWFTPDADSGDGQSAVSSGLLGLETIFNPGARNIAEAQKKGEITIKAEGEMYDRDLPEFIEVGVAERNEKDIPE